MGSMLSGRSVSSNPLATKKGLALDFLRRIPGGQARLPRKTRFRTPCDGNFWGGSRPLASGDRLKARRAVNGPVAVRQLQPLRRRIWPVATKSRYVRFVLLRCRSRQSVSGPVSAFQLSAPSLAVPPHEIESRNQPVGIQVQSYEVSVRERLGRVESGHWLCEQPPDG